MNPDAIIFDSDGVLVDSEKIHIAVERELLSELGLDYERAEYASRFVGLNLSDFHAALERDFRAKFNQPFPTDFGARLYQRVWPRIQAELEPVPDVTAILEVHAGPSAVASSAPKDRLREKLAITDLLGHFDPHIYSADLVNNGKPAPDLFLFAAQKLGVAPSACLVIEDSLHGIAAARAAGMSAIGFAGGGHADHGLATRLKAAGAHYVATNHLEIAQLLQLD
ncbi:MAG: HAD-IA family hydrolase [Henriciella sp.]|nr:HAD-IA family hydrolase [Henriciella sp.]